MFTRKKKGSTILTKRSPIKIFFAVQNALFLRELNMRFSSGKLGIFWTFFEPFFQIMIFIIIKMGMFGVSTNGFDFAVFLTLNFIVYNMFKNIVIKSSNAFSANKALFMYKQVKPINTVLARTMLELFITSIIIIIFLIIGFYFGYDIAVGDLVMVTLGFIFLLIFSFSFALLLAILNVFTESVGRMIGFLMTGLMFTSAVFYTVDMLPHSIQQILLYNPLLHFIEMIHGYYFVSLNDNYVSYIYITIWTLSLLYLSLWLYQKLEKRIISL
jgi:capsular polysaccharide transport system permease protein